MTAVSQFDFTCIDGIGNTMSSDIHEWSLNSDHSLLWRGLQKELHFEDGLDAEISREGETVKKIGIRESFCLLRINLKIWMPV